jgi:hypothetical protein
MSKKKPVYSLLLLSLPTVAVGVAVVILMIWRVPTRIEVNLTLDRAVFTLGGDDSTPILNKLSVQSIAVEKYARVQFSPAKLEIADPAQYFPAEDQYPESSWVLLAVTPPVVIVGEEDMLQPALILDKAPDANSVGILDRVWAQPGAEVTLEVSGKQAIHLTVKVAHQQSFAVLGFHEPFRLTTRYSQVSGIDGVPYKADSLTYRAELPENSPLIEIISQPSALVLALTMLADIGLEPFSKGGIPVTALHFTRQNSRGTPETTLVKEGVITYPDYPKVEKVSIHPRDFVSLDGLKQFRIEEMTLAPEHPGMRLLLTGVAGYIRTGSGAFPVDRRLTQFDALWHTPRLMALFSLVTWVFPTTVAGYRLFKELRG